MKDYFVTTRGMHMATVAFLYTLSIHQKQQSHIYFESSRDIASV